MLFLLSIESLLWVWLVKTDLQRLIIPDWILLCLIFLCWAEHACMGWATPLCLGCTLLLIKHLVEMILGRLALGWGDVKLGCVCGLWLSIDEVSLFLCITGFLGCITGMIALRVYRRRYFPLAPAFVGAFGVVRLLKGI